MNVCYQNRCQRTIEITKIMINNKIIPNYLLVKFFFAYSWLQNIWFWISANLCLLFRLNCDSKDSVNVKLKLRGQHKGIQKFEEIPSAKGLPLFGTILEFIANGSAPNLHKYIDKRHQKLGHIFRETLGAQEAVFVSSANLMRSVFLYEGQYPTHPLPESWVLYNKVHNCKRGLFFMDGLEWHTNRKILNRLLLNGNLNWLNLHVEYCTRKLISNWKIESKNTDYFKINDLEEKLYRWAIDVVCSVMFGFKENEASNIQLTTAIDAFSKNVHKIFKSSASLMNFPPKVAKALRLKIWTQFEHDVTNILRMGNDIIDMEIKSENECLEGLFIKMKSAGMTPEVIKRIFVDLIIAAGDTTAFSSQWALYLLSQNSDLQKKIRNEELSSHTENSVLHGFIKETLRLYPVAPFIGRFLQKNAKIGDYEVKENTMVILSLFTSGRHPDHFPDPLAVQPERWFRDSGTGQLRNVLHAHGTLPFGVGSRACIGKKLALKQMYTLVSEITQNFDIKCFNTKQIDVVLRLVAVPNQTLELGLRLLEA